MQREVLGEGELEHEPAALPILGDVPDPRLEHASRGDRGGVERAAADGDPCRSSAGRRPVIASMSSVWPLPSTPAIATISPARTANETPRTFSSPRSSKTCRSLTSSATSPGVVGCLLDAKQHVATDHHAGEPLLGRALARNRVDPLAAAKDGDPVGDLEHLVQLVA